MSSLLTGKSDKPVFVNINDQSGCSTEDEFYLNTGEIVGLEKYQDIDGFYKIDVEFSDGKRLSFEYYDEDEMEEDYSRIYDKMKYNGQDDESDSGDSEGSSDDDESEEPLPAHRDNIRLHIYAMTYGGSVPTPYKLYANATYGIYAGRYEYQNDEQYTDVYYNLLPNFTYYGDTIYVSVFYDLVRDDRDERSEDYYWIYDLNVHATLKDAKNDDDDGTFEWDKKKVFPVRVGSRPTRIEF